MRGAKRLRAGHPWVFRSDLIEAPAIAAGPVRIADQRGHSFGWAWWSPTSEIVLRRVDRDAERALRRGVIYRKLSGGTDSEAGSRFVERMLTVVATCRQQGRSVRDYLSSCFQFGMDARENLKELAELLDDLRYSELERPPRYILYAANSGTSSNIWNLWVRSVSISPLCTVDRSSRHPSMAVRNCSKSS